MIEKLIAALALGAILLWVYVAHHPRPPSYDDDDQGYGGPPAMHWGHNPWFEK